VLLLIPRAAGIGFILLGSTMAGAVGFWIVTHHAFGAIIPGALLLAITGVGCGEVARYVGNVRAGEVTLLTLSAPAPKGRASSSSPFLVARPSTLLLYPITNHIDGDPSPLPLFKNEIGALCVVKSSALPVVDDCSRPVFRERWEAQSQQPAKSKRETTLRRPNLVRRDEARPRR
jgi:hypothetical protein